MEYHLQSKTQRPSARERPGDISKEKQSEQGDETTGQAKSSKQRCISQITLSTTVCIHTSKN